MHIPLDILIVIITFIFITVGIFTLLYVFDRYPRLKNIIVTPFVKVVTRDNTYNTENDNKPITWRKALLFIVCSIIFTQIFIRYPEIREFYSNF